MLLCCYVLKLKLNVDYMCHQVWCHSLCLINFISLYVLSTWSFSFSIVFYFNNFPPCSFECSPVPFGHVQLHSLALPFFGFSIYVYCVHKTAFKNIVLTKILSDKQDSNSITQGSSGHTWPLNFQNMPVYSHIFLVIIFFSQGSSLILEFR